MSMADFPAVIFQKLREVKRADPPQLPGTGNGTTGTPKMANRGLLSLFNKDQYVALKNGSVVKTSLGKSILGNIGVKLGSGAATAGGAAAVGAAGVAGVAGIAAGVVSAAKNLYTAFTSKDKEEKKTEGYRGGTKLGMVGAGAATGAANRFSCSRCWHGGRRTDRRWCRRDCSSVKRQ